MHQFVQRTPSVVQQAVADVQQSRSTKRKRESYDDTTIKSVTDLCREHGVAAGCREYKRTKGVSVPENTAHGWLQHYQDSVSQGVPNAEAYKITQRRGRPPALTSGEKVLVNQALDGIRSAPNCESITAREVGAIARGIVSRERPAVLATHGGPLVLGKEFGKKFLTDPDFDKTPATSKGLGSKLQRVKITKGKNYEGYKLQRVQITVGSLEPR